MTAYRTAWAFGSRPSVAMRSGCLEPVPARAVKLGSAKAGGAGDDTAEMGADLLPGVGGGGHLGFPGLSAASARVPRFLFYVFVVIFLVLLILGLTIFRV